MPMHAKDINFNLYIRKCGIYKHLNLDKLYICYLQVRYLKQDVAYDPYKTPLKSILKSKTPTEQGQLRRLVMLSLRCTTTSAG